LAHAATFGVTYASGVFAVPMARTFRLSAWQYSLVGGLATTTFLLASATTGRLADRVGPRAPMSVGAVLVGAGLVGTATAGTFPLLLLAYVGCFATGVSLCFVPSLVAVARVQSARPALAVGVAASGAGVGTLVVGPLSAVLISHVGWRQTMASLAVIAFAMLVAAAALVGSQEQRPAFADPSSQRGGPALRTYVLAMVLVGLGYYVPFVHLVPGLVDRGLTLSGASNFLVVLGVANVAGRLVLGSLADHGRLGAWIAATIAMMGAATALLAVPGTAIDLVGVTIFGAAAGAFIAFVPAVALDLVGPARAGGTTGTLYAALGCGAALGPVIAGGVSAGPGGYSAAFGLAAAALFAGGLVARSAGSSTARGRACP
jgi:predicted MFS family arabinose efflux permease